MYIYAIFCLIFLHLFPSIKLIGNQLYLQQLSWGLYSISFSSSISIIIESHPLFFISYPMMSLFTTMILDLHSATFSQVHSFASMAISTLHYNKLRFSYLQIYIFLTISVQLWDSFKGWKISTIILLIRLVMIWLTYGNTNLKRTWVWSKQFLPPKPFNCMKFEVVNSFSKITFRITTPPSIPVVDSTVIEEDNFWTKKRWVNKQRRYQLSIWILSIISKAISY